ncbi:MAG TPA: PilZ domain-containing protein [bacterium]|nr:PilZ domain-containing protein [bacterium]
MNRLLYFLAQSTNLDLSALRFRASGAAAMNGVIGAALLVAVIIAAGIGAFFYLRSKRRAAELAEQREEARLKLMVSELNLGRSEIALLQTLLGGGDTADLLELMETRDTFEEAVSRFREANPSHPILKRISQLRQHLEYGFSNVRNPFVDTRMLAPGTRVRCRIRLPKRDVSFLTTVLGINENQFIIRPPTAKGKPVSLGGLRELEFRVSREHDAEYEFTCPIEGQLPTGTKPVMCGHTRGISRLLFRNADRIEVDIPTEFFVIRQEFASERTAGALRALDSQYRFDGAIRDVSIGGALVVANGHHEKVHEGDMIVFRLPAAQIKDDLVAQVVGLFQRDDGNTQVHLQYLGLKELNRLKLGKFLVGLKQSGATYTQGTKLAQQPPSVT